ncbi:MAG: Nitrite reductase, copper-containing [Chloroflexi bacterium]|nr:Nitrite reductase, copper-containing [Chloroflexota bacterium]
MRTLTIATLAISLLAVVIAGVGLAKWSEAESAIAARQLSPAASASANERIGTSALGPSKQTDVPTVARDPSIMPPQITRTEPTTVEINTTVKELTAEIADGATYDFWTFDGTVPGPLHRVMEGDTVRLTITNPSSSKTPHNIDLHVVNGPGGGAAVTNVAPGETKTFTFTALNEGAYAHHCAFAPPYAHIAQGMYGGIVVEPRGGLPKVDREFYVMQGDWYTAGAFGDKGHQGFSGAKALAEQPEYFTLNGHVAALTSLFPLRANVGETVRVFFGVGGPNIGSNFHVIGEVFDRVYSGASNTFTANEETWYVPPGSVSTFELRLDEPGQYLLVDHALWRVAKGALGVLMVEGAWNPSVYLRPPPPVGASH